MIWVSPEELSCATSEDIKEVGAWVVVTGKYQRSKDFPSSGFGHMSGYGAMISDAHMAPAEQGCHNPDSRN